MQRSLIDPLDSRSDNFTTSIVDEMTGRFVNSILGFVYGRDSCTTFAIRRNGPETNGGFVCATPRIYFNFTTKEEESRCGMQKHSSAVNLFTKRFLIETLCANEARAGNSLPNAKCFGIEFLNTRNDQEDEIYDSRSVSRVIFHRLEYIRNCLSHSFVQFI